VYRGRILGRNWDKNVKSFPPCASQYNHIVFGNLKFENSQDYRPVTSTKLYAHEIGFSTYIIVGGGGVLALRPTKIYIDRLETVPLFCLSFVRETWSTWAAVIKNTEAYRLEYCPDCHLALISLRKGAGEHFLHCDGIL
jgi:hypothetical protein